MSIIDESKKNYNECGLQNGDSNYIKESGTEEKETGTEEIEEVLRFLKIIREKLVSSKEITNLERSKKIDQIVEEYFDLEFINKSRDLIAEKCRETSKYVNILVEYSIIYIITGHKYLEKIWDEEIIKSDLIEKYKENRKDLLTLLTQCLDEKISRNLAREVSKKTEFIEQGLRGVLAQNLLAASAVKDENIIEMLTDSVMQKDRHAISNRKPEEWEASFRDLKEIKKYSKISCPVGEQEQSQVFLHSVTYKGNNHEKCDDFSGVRFWDDDNFIAFVSDGVGSAPFSNIGSRKLCDAFIKIVENRRSESSIFYYIFNQFSSDLYKVWEKDIYEYHQKEHPEREMIISDYTATFLFAWKVGKYFIAGILGDGNYLIEKRSRGSKSECGYLELTDGFSGVVQNNVYSAANLKEDPHALRISVFDVSEISAVMMTSDGAAAIKCKKIDDTIIMDWSDYLYAKDYFEELKLKNEFVEQKNYLHEIAQKFSCANKWAGGRGDDCSIAYIQMRREDLL